MKFIHAVGVLVLGAAVAACSGSEGGGGGGDRDRSEFAEGATFTTPMPSDPGNLHPLTAIQPTTNTIRTYAYDTLIYVDLEGQVVPQLAESWEATPDSVTFTVREGVTCTDGTEVTPSVVAETFEWIKNPDNASTMIGGNLPSTDFTVAADDDAGTVTIAVPEPYGFLLEGAGLVPIVCPDGLADPKSLARATNGTGPFVLTEYVPDDHLTMEAREGYAWGPDGATTDEPGFPAQVVFRIVEDPATAVNLFLSGEVSEVTPTVADQARLEGRDAFTVEYESGPTDLFFNQRAGLPGADPVVREALTMALDLGQLAEVMSEGNGKQAGSLTVLPPRPCRAEDASDHLPAHDPEGAAALLDEAGWVMGDGGVRELDGEPLSITLGYLSGDTATEAAMELVQEWWKDLGVEVEPKGQGANAFIGTLFGSTDWEAAFLNVQIAYPTEFVAFASGPEPDAGQNFAAIANEDYDQLAAEAAATPTSEGSCDLWTQAEHALLENLDVVPVANLVSTSYADHAEFVEGITSAIEPTSIRMYPE